jgi:hypothetical protein
LIKTRKKKRANFLNRLISDAAIGSHLSKVLDRGVDEINPANSANSLGAKVREFVNFNSNEFDVLS